MTFQDEIQPGDWYLDAGQGMGDVFMIASAGPVFISNANKNA